MEEEKERLKKQFTDALKTYPWEIKEVSIYTCPRFKQVSFCGASAQDLRESRGWNYGPCEVNITTTLFNEDVLLIAKGIQEEFNCQWHMKQLLNDYDEYTDCMESDSESEEELIIENQDFIA